MNMYSSIKESNITEVSLNENFGDTTDYSSKIESLIKSWYASHRGPKLLDYIDIEIELTHTNDEFKKPRVYSVNISGLRKGLNNKADDIGNYVADNISSLEYKGFEDTKILDTDFGSDVTLTFEQPDKGIPDFFEDSEKELKEAFELPNVNQLVEELNKYVQAEPVEDEEGITIKVMGGLLNIDPDGIITFKADWLTDVNNSLTFKTVSDFINAVASLSELFK